MIEAGEDRNIGNIHQFAQKKYLKCQNGDESKLKTTIQVKVYWATKCIISNITNINEKAHEQISQPKRRKNGKRRKECRVR